MYSQRRKLNRSIKIQIPPRRDRWSVGSRLSEGLRHRRPPRVHFCGFIDKVLCSRPVVTADFRIKTCSILSYSIAPSACLLFSPSFLSSLLPWLRSLPHGFPISLFPLLPWLPSCLTCPCLPTSPSLPIPSAPLTSLSSYLFPSSSFLHLLLLSSSLISLSSFRSLLSALYSSFLFSACPNGFTFRASFVLSENQDTHFLLRISIRKSHTHTYFSSCLYCSMGKHGIQWQRS